MPKKKTQKNLKELIDKADEIFPNLERREESKPLYVEALKIAKKEKKKLEEEYIQGKIDFIDKKWKDALKHFDEVIRLKADFFKAWHYKGALLHVISRYKEAMECYDKALEINPKYEYTWYYKGSLLQIIGRHEKAIECYDKGLEINPKNEYMWWGMGASLHMIGRYKEAIKCYDRALEINPKNESLWHGKGLSLSEMGRYEEALKCYNKALEINSKNKTVRNNINLVLMFLRRFEEARKERKKLYLEIKKKISESKIPDEEKEEKILEIDARKEVLDKLKDRYKEILDSKKTYEKKFVISLKPRDNPLSDNFFLVLRRWNSYTPMLLTATESNLGGGYFLHWKGKGIVIDPGFDFLDNFFNNKLVIYDINAVIITHAHVDHYSDFESLLTLIFEYNEKNKEKKKIGVFMNLGAMKKLLGWISIEEDKENALINRIYPLEKGISYDLEAYNLKLEVTKAIHNEVLSKAYSVGLIFELYGESNFTKEESFRIGYTSDTKHDEKVEEQYRGMDIIIPHIGSIDKNDFNLEEGKRDENHLMLKGVISTIHKSNAKLAIISEFGEELGEHRMTIVGALDRVFQKK